uniref:Uncharacterized protein n=1 Tax=Tanacetum cinerariifolium TaxID=118510 RepID=A0A6L2LTN8_TANCI|nr:hypothetical protein [Tanacetum cinerariifolium]
MNLESAQNNAVTKLPLLKQGDYEMWKLRIEQYFQVQDYALWDVIENGNSFKLVHRTIANADGTSTSTIPGPVTTEEKAQKRMMLKLEAYLEQIHEDDLKEIDLKWQLALLSMRARRSSNQDNLRKTVNVEYTSSKAMVAIDGAGFDWSYIADDEVPTNMALMAFSGSKDFQHPEFKGYGPKDSKSVYVDTSNDIKKAPDALIIEDWVSDSDEDESEEMVHKPEQANQPRKMVQTLVLKNEEKGTVQREVRPVWNNAMRTNHQNFSNFRRNFAPTTVLTKSDIVPLSTARQSSSRAATPVSAARPINTAASKPLVNVATPRQNALQTSHSLSRRHFYQQTSLKKQKFK